MMPLRRCAGDDSGGRYPRRRAIIRIILRVRGAMRPVSLSALDTVDGDTWAAAATCRTVTLGVLPARSAPS